MNVTKAKLERLFADELALLEPTPGCMRLLKESVLQIWKARQAGKRRCGGPRGDRTHDHLIKSQMLYH